jgi:Ser/Thr protein kinase RdoA (MazF antagonist)
VSVLGAGLINDTRLVDCTPAGRYVLQRLNPRVFPRPDRVMENIGRVLAHGRSPLPRLVPSRSGALSWTDADGGCWRVYEYLEGTLSRAVTDSPATARRAAMAFGGFLAGLSDLPAPRLHETLPGFHDTPGRLRDLLAACAADPCGRWREVQPELDLILARADQARLLATARAEGALPERVVHNDTKLANVLFDAASGELRCVIDLDTVMPGLALDDFGDLARSVAATAPEDRPGLVVLDLPRFEAVASGYLQATAGLLTRQELELMPLAPRLIALELAMRFLTDHLQGDVYFRVSHEGHNLERCRAQIGLLQSMEAKESAMRGAVQQAARSGIRG